MMFLMALFPAAFAQVLQWPKDPTIEHYPQYKSGYIVYFDEDLTKDCAPQTEYVSFIDVGPLNYLDITEDPDFEKLKRYKFQVSSYMEVEGIRYESNISPRAACLEKRNPLEGVKDVYVLDTNRALKDNEQQPTKQAKGEERDAKVDRNSNVMHAVYGASANRNDASRADDESRLRASVGLSKARENERLQAVSQSHESARAGVRYVARSAPRPPVFANGYDDDLSFEAIERPEPVQNRRDVLLSDNRIQKRRISSGESAAENRSVRVNEVKHSMREGTTAPASSNGSDNNWGIIAIILSVLAAVGLYLGLRKK